MPEADDISRQERVVDEIIQLQREFYFENKDKVSERRRRLREIVERFTPIEGA
jgi:hypothetical protein